MNRNVEEGREKESVKVETVDVGGRLIPVITDEIRKGFENATGVIPYPLSNDRMFRGILSYSESVRRTTFAILLRKREEEIETVELLNPVSFGQTFTEKETEEDVRVLINSRIRVDSELQNFELKENNRRFLLYHCRNVDDLKIGESYNSLKSNVFVELANYVRDDAEEFLSEYRILNKKTFRPLFDEDLFFAINVLNLKHTELADENDSARRMVLLAELIQTKAWEELRELAKSSPFAQEVAYLMYASNVDEREKIALDAARRYDEMMSTLNENMDLETQARIRAERRAEDAENRAENAENRAENAEAKVRDLEKMIDGLRAQLNDKNESDS